MNDRQKAFLAWILFALVAISAIAQFIVNLGSQSSTANPLDLLGTLLWGIAPVVFALVGALIIARQPRNVIGLLLMLPPLVFTIPVDIYLARFTAAPPEPNIFVYGASWFGSWGWLLLIMPVLFILVLFPTGEPLTPRWRWPIFVGLGMSAVFIFFITFAREMGPVDGDWSVSNPIGFIDLTWFDDYLLGPWFILLPSLTIVCAAALFVRYRRAGLVEREQIKWLFYVGVLFAIFYALSFTDTSASDSSLWNVLFVPSLLGIPIAIGIAILRYRLFDIDIIIRKTLLYGLLTVALIAVYSGSVLLAQSAFEALTSEESPIAIVISTLIIAALFSPLRQRLQAFIDKRFYRSSYDAAQALELFAQTARDEVAIEALTTDLQQVIQGTVQPQTLSIWLPAAVAPHAISQGEASDV